MSISQRRTRRLIPVTAWKQYHAWPSEGGLRWLIFNGDSNGFGAVVRRAGRRVLIDQDAFFEWVDSRSADFEREWGDESVDK